MSDDRSPAMKKLDLQIKENVQRGLVFLREEYGDNWVEHISLENLDLTSASCCVLGQLHPDGYDEAIYEFFDSHESAAIRHGFCANFGEWDRLQKAWENAIPNEQTRVARQRKAGLTDAVAAS